MQNFITLEGHKTTGTSTHQQMFIRYVLNGYICERFSSFFNNSGNKAKTLLVEIPTILNSPARSDFYINILIAQRYNGTSVMSG